MPEGNAAAAAGPARREEEGSPFYMKIFQGIAIWMGTQFVLKQFFGERQPAAQVVTNADGKTLQVPANTAEIPPYLLRPRLLDDGATSNPIPQRIAPIWPEDSAVVDVVVTISPSVAPTPLDQTPADDVVLRETRFKIGNYSDKRTVDTTIRVPRAVQNNGTLWGHFYVGLSGAQLDPAHPSYDPATAYHFVYPLTHHIPRKRQAKTRNLLAGKEGDGDAGKESERETHEGSAAADDEQPGALFVGNYYHPNTTLSFVPNSGVLHYPQTHPAIRPFLHLEATGARDGSGQNSWYYPILFVNTFWQLRSHMTLLNETVDTLPLHLDLTNLADWKFKILASMEMSSRAAAQQAAYGNPLPGGGDGSEFEMIKEIFMDTNPILLGVTVVVSIAHLVLETLAFGSDIAHYRRKKDNVGISVRSILANVFMQTVIFLYLVDQSQNTSWMILGTQGVGILIELWKITTVVDVRLRRAPPGSWIPYRLSLEDKHRLSETEARTKEYDEIAFRYMYWAAVPLLAAYAVYSLVYDTHKSWYSYILTTLVGSVYAYGFLMMVPSLYINYRLKSVAHMPGKAMLYKFLNTFIDDLFAFTIKMPFLHRLATFRDDVIFFVYLYQRWAYRVDYSRVNEFGQGGEEDVAEEQKKVEDTKSGEKDENKKKVPDVDAAAKKATGVDAGTATKRR
ncbi:hypothetical protein VTK73DRAFT_8793 [Phialemonium thermophilum]|uniref:Cleft lip and palate transmembrane protein 1 n=1 Tax=Phialemonium thermophilum TaxID=223376 RepID=A0ABR3W6L6_9PEZI